MCWTLDASDARAARSVRKAATQALGTLTSSVDLLGAAELVIGELLANAARYSDGRVCLELGADQGLAEISVHDSSAAFDLQIERPMSDFAESGRGLYIISKLARHVRIQPYRGIGKRVSVTLDLPLAASDAPFDCSRRWLRDGSGVCFGPRLARYASAPTERREA